MPDPTAGGSAEESAKGVKRTAEGPPSSDTDEPHIVKELLKRSRRLSTEARTKSMATPTPGESRAGKAGARSKDAVPMSFADFKSYMDVNFAGVREEMKSTRKELGQKVDIINEKLAGQESDVADLQRTVMAIEDREKKRDSRLKKLEDEIIGGINNRVKEAVSAQIGTLPGRTSTATATSIPDPDQSMTRAERDFYRARRSLKIWPIDGADSEVIWGNTGNFLHEVLRIPHSEMDQTQIEHISKSGPMQPEGSPVHDEVLVLFCTAAARDRVLRGSANLANRKTPEGVPTAGIRIEVPLALRGVFNILERYGHFMRRRYGKGTKTHIKFDEAEMSLYCNVRLPGETEWARIMPKFARRTLRNRDETVSESWESRYGSQGEESREPGRRSRSEGGMPDPDVSAREGTPGGPRDFPRPT